MSRRTKAPRHFPAFPLAGEPDFLSCTAKQQAFLFEYFMKPLTGKTNSECYMTAYGSTMKKSTSHSAASKLIHATPKISRMIRKIAKVEFERLRVSKQRIMNEEKTIAFSDIAELFDEHGCLVKNPTELPERVRRSISSITEITDKNGDIRYTIKLWSKGDSLKRLQKMKGLYQPLQHVIQGPNGGPVKVKMESEYDFSILTDDELILFKKLLKKAKK